MIGRGQSHIAITASGPAGRDKITWDKMENIKNIEINTRIWNATQTF